MRTLLILIGVLLYLLIGSRLFTAGVNAMGGSEEYLNYLHETKPNVNAFVMFGVAQFLVIIFWPYFLIKGISSKGE